MSLLWKKDCEEGHWDAVAGRDVGTWGHAPPARSQTEGTGGWDWVPLSRTRPPEWESPHCGASSPRAGTAGHGMSSSLGERFSHWKNSECTNDQELSFPRLNAALAWGHGTSGHEDMGHGDMDTGTRGHIDVGRGDLGTQGWAPGRWQVALARSWHQSGL